MATVDKLVSQGIWPTVATEITGDYAAAQTSAGTTQATAAPLVADRTQFTTVAAGSGVILRAIAGEQYVYNHQGVNALLVYPPVGGTINAQAANADISVAANKSAEFFSPDGVNFVSVVSA